MDLQEDPEDEEEEEEEEEAENDDDDEEAEDNEELNEEGADSKDHSTCVSSFASGSKLRRAKSSASLGSDLWAIKQQTP